MNSISSRVVLIRQDGCQVKYITLFAIVKLKFLKWGIIVPIMTQTDKNIFVPADIRDIFIKIMTALSKNLLYNANKNRKSFGLWA